jgi:spore coat polysaccharide biosynthesis protein SpsF
MIATIIQARVGSTRLPNKICKTVKGKTMLEFMLDRVKLAKRIDRIIVAIPDTKENDDLAVLCQKCGVLVFRGSENDVLSRYYHAATTYELDTGTHIDTIVRLTSDCPLIDPTLIDYGLENYKGVDLQSNCITRTYPDGEDIEIMSFSALERAHNEATDEHDREHVTTYIACRPDKFDICDWYQTRNISHMRWTLDYPEDYEFIKAVIEEFHPRVDFSMEEIVALLERKPEIAKLNAGVMGKDNLKIAKEMRKSITHP